LDDEENDEDELDDENASENGQENMSDEENEISYKSKVPPQKKSSGKQIIPSLK
jgi:hypothetical protein